MSRKTIKPNILMIVENSFPGDPRVRKEAEYLSQWYGINVIAIKGKGEKYIENVDGNHIFRIPELPDIDLGRIRYILEYAYFTFFSAVIFICTAPFKRYKVVHVHNPPDTLFIVGAICKLFGMKFIFDHHDLSPNLYLTRFSGKQDFIYKILLLCEKYSCKLADVIISTNETYKQIEIDRHNVSPEKIFIVRNNPILEECLLSAGNHIDPDVIQKNKIQLLFIGAINPQDGMNELLQAIHHLVNKLNEKNFICNIIGGGDSLLQAQEMAEELKIGDYVNFTGTIYDRKKVKEYFYLADIGVEPAPDNELNSHSTFIKVMEYMAAGIPIVAFDLKETRFSAQDSALLVPPNDIEAFADNIRKLLNDKDLREKLGNAGQNRIKNDLNWANATSNLKKAYDTFSF